MDNQLLQKIVDVFGTEPLAGSTETYAKVLVHPDNTIAIYFINAERIKETLESKGYAWSPQLHAWIKTVATIEEAQQETSGFPATAAALSQIQ